MQNTQDKHPESYTNLKDYTVNKGTLDKTISTTGGAETEVHGDVTLDCIFLLMLLLNSVENIPGNIM